MQGAAYGPDQFFHGIAVVSLCGIGLCRPSGADCKFGMLRYERVGVSAIGPTVFENDIEPFFQEGWARIPIEWKLENDPVILLHQFLFALNVYVEIWIALVEIIDFD